MYHVVAATRNPAKIKAITGAFADVFGPDQCHISAAETESGVADQPMSSQETLTGARQRVFNARQQHPEADFWVAIEAGIDENQTFGWIVIENTATRAESRSASLPLPSKIMDALRQGQELGHVMAGLTGIENIKQKGGAISVITDGLLTRTSVYHQALLLALCSMQHPLYQQATLP